MLTQNKALAVSVPVKTSSTPARERNRAPRDLTTTQESGTAPDGAKAAAEHASDRWLELHGGFNTLQFK